MTEQDPLVRNANFDEVNLGLPEKVALLEAERCLQCKDPKCIAGCPVSVNIPRFIELLSQGNLPEAAHCLLNDNALPAVTGRVCPQETQCEIECIRGNKGLPVAIGYLERYVGDWARGHSDQQTLAACPAQRQEGGRGRLRPRRAHRRGRTGQIRPRRHGLRGPAQAGRRAGLWHPGIPPAQEDRPGRGGPAGAGRGEDRLQHRHWPDLHLAGAARAVRRRVHRQRRRPARVHECARARTSRASIPPTSTSPAST